jgi:transketolase
MADNNSETPSEGHKKVRKKISVYQTAVDINKKQKEIKKKVDNGNADVNTVTEQYEGKFKNKLESYTQKSKEKSKQFKETAKNQLSQLIETFKMSASNGEDAGANSETETIDVQELKTQVAEKETLLAQAKKDNNTGNVKIYQ